MALGASTAAFAANPITGVVTNRTNGKPAAGDDVVLIRLAQGMQEATRTKTDAHGRFTLDVPDEGIHLVRVTHDGANYFRPAPPGTQSVELDVYNAAAKVKGVSNEADVLRIQTDPAGNGLRVTENFFVKNDSNPPLTQFSKSPFDFYLPQGAVVEGSAALAPGGMPVQASPLPLDDPGHYTFIFPIRPGETRFQVTYHVPYSGSLNFTPRIAGRTGTIAIMLPKSMKFTPVSGSPFQPVEEEVNAQTYVARDVVPTAPLGFALSGTGQLPRDNQNPDQGAQSGPAASGGGQQAAEGAAIPATQNTAPGKGLDNPLDPEGTRDPWSKYKWWIVGGVLLLLAGGAGTLLSRPAQATGAAGAGPQPPVPAGDATLAALKEELFALETERLQNTISDEDYAQHKAALETVLRRKLGRQDAAQRAGTAPAERS